MRPKVKIFSYHIPKTAGTSFRKVLQHELGRKKVTQIYVPETARALSSGTVPRKTINEALHGHYKPHPNHLETFPDAQTIVWVRDPIERIWSHVGHLLRHKDSHPHYADLRKIELEHGIYTQEELVTQIIKDESLKHVTNTYQRFFKKVPISAMSFVGSVHFFERDLKKLSEKMSWKFYPQKANVSPGSIIPTSVKRLKNHLQEEYELVSNYL
ncbi:sulfotransferase family 2 domain-containing protein [Alteromonas sp. H39]|uniref:sulfotransferase family 2 domain-containing protein n=1 Tax=Alteromonas sp. H39 TaxID=3389876 RepID=UPI0039E00663